MKFVGNRSFLLTKPKKPFVDWINGYDDSEIPEKEIFSHKNLYMIENLEYGTQEEKEGLLKKNYKEIFINELWLWYQDEDYLPKKFSLKMFKEWFDYEIIEMCYDAMNNPLTLL
jgi:hypothetical protein